LKKIENFRKLKNSKSGKNSAKTSKWKKTFNYTIVALEKLHIVDVGVEASQLPANAVHTRSTAN